MKTETTSLNSPSFEIPLHPFRQTPGLCGAASLKIILEYFEIHKTEAELATLSGATPEIGVPATGILTACKALGFTATIKDEAEFKNIEECLAKKIPVMVQWWLQDDGHWSPVTKIDSENIYLQDPNLGSVRALTKETFYRNWFDFHRSIMKKENLLLRRMISIERK